jgi:hypothetical protein
MMMIIIIILMISMMTMMMMMMMIVVDPTSRSVSRSGDRSRPVGGSLGMSRGESPAVRLTHTTTRTGHETRGLAQGLKRVDYTE